MNLFKAVVVLALASFALAPTLGSAAVVIDLDGSTPAFETSLVVPQGTVLNIKAYETSFAQPFDTIGVDLYYLLPSDTLTVTPVFPTPDAGGSPSLIKAGSLADDTLTGNSVDHVSNLGPVTSGVGLASAGLPSAGGFTMAMGGGAYRAVPTSGDFLPLSTPYELMSWDMMFTGVGSATLTVCGILSPTGAPTVPMGDAYYDTQTNTAYPTVCGPPVTVTILPAIIPEPATASLLILVTLYASTRRRPQGEV